ncbi:MAG TPA: hypothetical protein ENK44_11165 [Caldithrix abyssi]|uniref:NodB homology domain-containing protein n=1 Tax=Caldithrix abyssi TaxID=187145 RepID=A0A7V4U1G5_CALAY|nr:hypothetical protein [Caldithrix abyssi]
MKAFIKKIFIRSGVIRTLSSFSERVVILKYHSVLKEPKEVEHTIGTGIVHSLNTFDEQMALISGKYTPVTMNDLVSFAKGEKKVPRRAVVVTFDDGFADNLEFAAPVLERYGIKAAFYITVNNVENQSLPWFVRLRIAVFNTNRLEWQIPGIGITYPLHNEEQKYQVFIKACRRCASLPTRKQQEFLENVDASLQTNYPKMENFMLNWDQIKKLAGMGHIIGSHSMSHPNLAYLEQEDLIFELGESKKIIEKQLKKKIDHFSYPNPALEPNWTEKTMQAAHETGYLTAVTSTPGPFNLNDNLHAIRRMWVPSDKDEFIWYLERTFSGSIL